LSSAKNILVCPLDWGLGHATRCVPIIKKLMESGANVLIGADNRPLAFLKKEFPTLQFIKFPGYEIRYPEKGSMVMKMFFSVPRILSGIRQERKHLQKIINENKIDIVISDNRYGLWNKNIKCIFMTHQLSVKCPKWLKFAESILFQINKHFIKNFDECWIPDVPGEIKLSGSLTKRYEQFKNIHFIGLLSRFAEPLQTNNENTFKHNVLCILSGPEPQRTVFEDIILHQLQEIKNMKVLILRGITETDEIKNISENVQMVNHLETTQLEREITSSEMIICRPGYSSIMDIVTLGKKAVFVPTPGQTEQEYLGKYYKERKLFYSISQQQFNLIDSIEKSKDYSGFKINSEQEKLNERIRFLLK